MYSADLISCLYFFVELFSYNLIYHFVVHIASPFTPTIIKKESSQNFEKGYQKHHKSK